MLPLSSLEHRPSAYKLIQNLETIYQRTFLTAEVTGSVSVPLAGTVLVSINFSCPFTSSFMVEQLNVSILVQDV